MVWITRFFVVFLAMANDYAWLAVDPVAILALAKTNCTLPTLGCLRHAKTFHAQLIQEHTNAYWCRVNEDHASVEHEKQAKEAHGLYVAQQMAKGDKWDMWECRFFVFVAFMALREIFRALNWIFMKLSALTRRPPPPPPSPQVQPPLPQAQPQPPRALQQQVMPDVPTTKTRDKKHAHLASHPRSSANKKEKTWPPGPGKYASAIESPVLAPTPTPAASVATPKVSSLLPVVIEEAEAPREPVPESVPLPSSPLSSAPPSSPPSLPMTLSPAFQAPLTNATASGAVPESESKFEYNSKVVTESESETEVKAEVVIAGCKRMPMPKRTQKQASQPS
ncbi:hypothetical protein E8E11_000693 [Didymella keratinophila]|nr:hypothetical protein E8E11_000693 [Didymella keratinophila]